jgi:hypothetical protein
VVVVMLAVAVTLFAVAIAVIWYVVARGQHAELVTEHDFDDAYDELVRKGELTDGDRDKAWNDFHAWQVENAERRAWEEPDDG